jgi:hypothetical protein
MFMELVLSSGFGRMFFIAGTLAVLYTLWLGYFHNTFHPIRTSLIVVVLVLYISIFLWHRYTSGDMQTDVSHEPLYIGLAAIHGTISLWAIVQASYMFIAAKKIYERGENYFRLHKHAVILTAVLWPLALASGLLI